MPANNKKLIHNIQLTNLHKSSYYKLNYQTSRRRFCFFHLGYTNEHTLICWGGLTPRSTRRRF